MSFETILAENPHLSVEERKHLISAIVDTLAASTKNERTHSLLEFEGIGKSLYDGTDAQDYVNQLRREWDDRP